MKPDIITSTASSHFPLVCRSCHGSSVQGKNANSNRKFLTIIPRWQFVRLWTQDRTHLNCAYSFMRRALLLHAKILRLGLIILWLVEKRRELRIYLGKWAALQHGSSRCTQSARSDGELVIGISWYCRPPLHAFRLGLMWQAYFLANMLRVFLASAF